MRISRKRRGPSLAHSFLLWLQVEGSDLLGEIEATKVRHRVDIAFRRLPELHGCLRGYCLSVSAERHGECWDFIFDRDVVVVPTREGWQCRLCPEPETFATRQALWVDHLFAPFAEWIRGPLARTKYVAFHRGGREGGITNAYLREEVPDRITLEKARFAGERSDLEKHASAAELEAFDRARDQRIEDIWEDFREEIDEELLEAMALRSLGPEGIAYVASVTDDDFEPFDPSTCK